MRGPHPTHPIQLSDTTAARLRRIMRAHTTAQTLVVRVQIVITAHDHPDLEYSADGPNARHA